MAKQPDRDAEFTEYVSARQAWLRRVAFLLCGDWHRADDLVQSAITKLYAYWHKARRADNLDGYARRTLVNTYLAEQRSGWAKWTILHRFGGGGETAADPDPDRAALTGDLDLGLDLKTALAKLPPRQRATVVLRFYCDMSVEQTAQVMGCSTGNVKSQSSRGLANLRSLLDPNLIPVMEAN
ncbi:RNA polymerase sigma-70 factor (sigma-E family) [Catenulispora sp. MAP5-51]|uniref:SigE family RNA polymerase sigma factor n=1 Tax=Catenulispora sp. MAP5-51 TaxID=3156298 RepID=UPI0035130B97